MTRYVSREYNVLIVLKSIVLFTVFSFTQASSWIEKTPSLPLPLCLLLVPPATFLSFASRDILEVERIYL